MKKGTWVAIVAVAALTVAYAVTKVIVRGSKPRVIAFGSKDHENRNFNSFPIDIPEEEFDNWLS